ncbi:hypothetical protein G9A89_006742 [Geosiphon pyriformis]|nr:hypothetical protein G9A89_006742 [Geosiphon pyriformis]
MAFVTGSLSRPLSRQFSLRVALLSCPFSSYTYKPGFQVTVFRCLNFQQKWALRAGSSKLNRETLQSRVYSTENQNLKLLAENETNETNESLDSEKQPEIADKERSFNSEEATQHDQPLEQDILLSPQDLSPKVSSNENSVLHTSSNPVVDKKAQFVQSPSDSASLSLYVDELNEKKTNTNIPQVEENFKEAQVSQSEENFTGKKAQIVQPEDNYIDEEAQTPESLENIPVKETRTIQLKDNFMDKEVQIDQPDLSKRTLYVQPEQSFMQKKAQTQTFSEEQVIGKTGQLAAEAKNESQINLGKASQTTSGWQKNKFFQKNGLGTNTKKITWSPLVAILSILGISGLGLSSLTLYHNYTSKVHQYPEEIKKNLRQGLYYQNYKKDPNLAVDYFKRALTEALNSSELDNSSPQVTGIMIHLGGLYEDLGRTRDAIDVLSMAYDAIVTPNNVSIKLDGDNRIKSIGIAQKLGDLHLSLKQDDLAEKYYGWSVGQLLTAQSEGIQVNIGSNGETGIFGGGLFQNQFDMKELPSWMTSTDLGSSLEALASFYSSRHKYTHALPLYIRALSLIDTNESPCHSAVLMNNISEVFTGMGDLELAQGWAERGLKVTQQKAHLQKKNSRECSETCGVLLFNLGMIAELSGDLTRASEFYEKSLVHAKNIGFDDCVVEADSALQRINGGLNNSVDVVSNRR